MSSTAANSYDEVPYIGHAYNYTHPARLSVIGVLHGLQPAPVEACRVLELGCGDGGNLLPMAYTLPHSAFYGIDLAAKPIAEGNSYAAELGLSNLKLDAMDIMDFPADAGVFDYIVTHGIYSWVPAFVREKILAICARHLAPHGIAYISYKTYPGSTVSGTIHEMMRFQAARRPGSSEEEIVHAGLDMLRLTVNSKKELDAYRGALKWRLDAIEERMKNYGGYSWIYHDIGVEVSEPFFFHDVMRDAVRHGLQFLSEPELGMPAEARYTPETAASLAALGDDVVAREQYDDFLSNREFRRTLFCRPDLVLDRAHGPERFVSLYAASPLQALTDDAPADDPLAKEEFLAPGGVKVKVDQPVVKAALRLLGTAWPRAVSFDEMMSASAPPGGATDETARQDRDEDVNRLGSTLLAIYRADMIALTTYVPQKADTLSERPVASAWLRQQIAHQRPILTNLAHAEVEVGDVAVRHLLTLLDGTRDRATLLEEMGAWLDHAHTQYPKLPTREWFDENIDIVLTGFVRQQFLVA